MGKFNDYGLIGVIVGFLLLILKPFLHKPLRKIKYYRHKILTKNVISNKIIEIELIKKDKSDINRQIRISEIKFCFHGFDKYNKEFVDNLLIERIDDNDLIFEKNDDVASYKIKIPFEFSIKYFDAKEIKLTVSYRTPLDNDFIVHDRQINLIEITNRFKILIDRQKVLINHISPLSKEERFELFDQELPKRDDEKEYEYELSENQFTLGDNGIWVNNIGETPEEYDKKKGINKTEPPTICMCKWGFSGNLNGY